MATVIDSTTVSDAEAAVSWRAIIAGAIASAALTLVLVAFGVGVGFSVISPYSGQGLSATGFTISAGIYLIVIAMLSSTIGGYLAGRLRPQWPTVHSHERYFRDSAHGFVTWALATVVTVTVLGGATSAIIGQTGAGLASASSTVAATTIDRLMRPAPAVNGVAAVPPAPTAQQAQRQTSEAATSPTATGQTPPPLQGGSITAPSPTPANDVNRSELGRLIANGLGRHGAVSAADRAYIASLIVMHTGLTQPEAEQRVDQVIAQAKSATDAARKSSAAFAFWLAFAMLAGALSAALAAIEGGNLRNRDWYLTDAERARLAAAR
ncbi:MAG: hypothetical protein GC182_10070 [Rhodopseudomonas sp.]|nr:hypothetical protein [Rhodopseudomonas sp.]